ncbi:MepB family protein [Candidatus Enterococcus mansonii]|uniref:MepB protein n=1 Tax=Candidatus Enterococcus mansonii TaxID=1834181 RepID=A0A242CIA6_9ENTE|nr:MepB family protein [Enterococcus sp. 4G2_DIV0659]OTO09512.1 hypothetical protein A5880_000191 [Enterococcus sp. 4G2_DIV0659]
MESISYLTKIIQKISQHPLENLKLEEQNKAYEGATFSVGNHTFRSRKAKITPKKAGYFVVFWEKDEENKNRAYDVSSAPDKLIVTIFDQEKVGQFIFPKHILLKNNVLSNEMGQGKMALRVYPTWVTGLNKHGTVIQQWQIPFFIDLTSNWELEKLKTIYFL